MQRRHTKLAAALLAAFTGPAALNVLAQEKIEAALPQIDVRGQNPSGDYAPATSTVGGKTATPLRDIPQTVNVINRAALDAQSAASLADALRYVPGITISAGEGGQIGNNINLRGFSARTDLYLDGMRDRGQYYRDTFFLDAIEVLKGPSSMLFGRGSTGGVINQVSKRPSRRPSNEVSVTLGTDDYYRATADFNRPLSETSALRLGLMGQDISSTRDVINARDYGIAPSLRLAIGTPTEITLSAVVQHNQDIPDYGIPFRNGKPVDVPTHNFYGMTDDRTIQDIGEYTLRVEHKFNSALSLRNQTRYSTYEIDARPSVFAINAAPASSPLDQLTVTLNRRDRVIDDHSLYNQADLIAKFDTGTVKHTLISGIEVGRDEYENQGNTWTGLPNNINLVNPVYQSTPSGAVRTQNATHVETAADAFGVYANDTLELSKQWKVVAGLRWDRFKAEQDTITNATGARTTLAQTDKMTSTRAGLIYQPSDTQSYYMSYGTSFNPSAEAVTLTAAQTGVPPEKNRSYELGGKWDVLQGNLSLSSALFRIEKTNARSADPVTTVVSLDGDIRVEGIEVGAVGRITPRWQVLAGYTYLDAEIVKSVGLQNGLPTQGNVPANTPKNTATLWTTYRLAPSWEIGGGAIHLSSRFVSNANNTSVDGYTRLDATLAYLQPRYDIRLNVINLTDEKYFDTVIPSDGGRTAPGRGRTGLVTATYRF